MLRGECGDVFRIRASSLELWLPELDAAWTGGCRNGAELWRRLGRAGFGGSLRVVTEWATRRRRAEAASEWLHDAAADPLASFANGLRADRSAVAAALALACRTRRPRATSPSFKLVTRQMYGRAKLYLLRARLLGSA